MPKVLTIAVFLAMTVATSVPVSGQIPATVFADDGTGLATDVYLPVGSGSHPVILIRTPYGKDGFQEVCIVFTLLQYACVAQDTRGRGDSGGVDTVFRNDAGDGRATVRWLSEQSWCDGNVGMLGGSAFGITQYLPAPGADPTLRSIAPVVATPDLYHHAFLQGGALREVLATNWLDGQGSQHFLDEVLQHRLKDAWWDPVEVIDHAGSIHSAGLHVGGWYDIFGQGTLDGFMALQDYGGSGAAGRQRLVMGPWTHGGLFTNSAGALSYPLNAVRDPITLLTPWYDATLRGDSEEIDDWPVASIYLMGAVGEPGAPGNRWLDLDRWPPQALTRSLYLSVNGDLERQPPEPGDMTLVSDPLDPVPTLGGANLHPDVVVDGRRMGDGPQDQRHIEDRPDVLTFTTAVLSHAETVVGPIRAKLWMVPDTLDLDLAVRLTDVYPDGRSMLVLDGVQRARMRCGSDTECLLTPGLPVEITVELWSTAMVFNAGHRMRVSVSGSNWPRFEVNPNNGSDLNLDLTPVVARPRLLFGHEHPSRIELPLLPMTRRASGQLQPQGGGVRFAPSSWPLEGVDVGGLGQVFGHR